MVEIRQKLDSNQFENQQSDVNVHVSKRGSGILLWVRFVLTSIPIWILSSWFLLAPFRGLI